VIDVVKSINVTEETWEKLMLLKIKLRARSLDEVIKKLLEAYQKRTMK